MAWSKKGGMGNNWKTKQKGFRKGNALNGPGQEREQRDYGPCPVQVRKQKGEMGGFSGPQVPYTTSTIEPTVSNIETSYNTRDMMAIGHVGHGEYCGYTQQ